MDRVQVVAIKRINKTRPGEVLLVTPREAKTLKALGFAKDFTGPVPTPPQQAERTPAIEPPPAPEKSAPTPDAAVPKAATAPARRTYRRRDMTAED